MGIDKPSSNTSVASADSPRPPMSMAWQVLPKKPIRRRSRNTGVTTEMSLSCPDVFHGSLVIRTSPGESVSGGNAARKWCMAVASELMCPGVPVTAWASMRPRASNTDAERSPDSRTIGVNEVRCRAAACSFATVTSRLHRISRVTGSSRPVRAVLAALTN